MFSFADALAARRGSQNTKSLLFELNAGNHAHKTRLASALALQAIERDGRIPVVNFSKLSSADGQNDNGWDQGLLFSTRQRFGFKPPGYLTQILLAISPQNSSTAWSSLRMTWT
jgi:hypothetical protein